MNSWSPGCRATKARARPDRQRCGRSNCSSTCTERCWPPSTSPGARGSRPRSDLGPRMRAPRASRNNLARSRRGHLGGARRQAAVHPFEDDVLGRLRSRRPVDRGVRPAEPLERWREARDTISASVCEHGFDAGRRTRSCSRTARPRSMPAFFSSRRSASCRPRPARAWDDRRDRAQAHVEDGLVMRYDTGAGRRRVCLRAKATSSPAASGSRTITR